MKSLSILRNKALLIVLSLLLCCFSCSKDKDTVSREYIDPVRDVFIYDLLDQSLKDRIYKANDSSSFDNYQFKMLFKDIYRDSLTDIYGNSVSLTNHSRIFLEIVSTKCSHCKNQLNMVDEFLKYDDVLFVQYFNVGDNNDVISFYNEAGISIPENAVIISRDEQFKDYITDELGVQLYPTLISFLDNKVQFVCGGEINGTTLDYIYDISFVEPLKESDFIDEQGNNLFDRERTVEDVRQSLVEDDLNMLRQLDNDELTMELTLNNIGRKFDYLKASNSKNSLFINEVDDFNYYADKDTVFIYTYLRDNSETDKVSFINELIEKDEYNYVVLLAEGMESSSQALRNMSVSFECPVVSLSSSVPDDFYSIVINQYPSALFIKNGVVAGVYSNITDKESFDQAKQLFLGEDSIVYKK